MEDLDSLLEDLGRGKSASTVKKQRPPSSRVDLNELENLMEDLAAPTAKAVPEPTPVQFTTTNTSSNNPPPPSNNKSFNNGSSSSSVNSTFTPPKSNDHDNRSSTASFSQSSSNNSSKNPPPANIDDLDALMESLNTTSGPRSQRRSVIPSNSPSSSPSQQHATSSPSTNNSSSSNTVIAPQVTIAPKQTQSYSSNPTPSNHSSSNSSSSMNSSNPPSNKPTPSSTVTTNTYTPPPQQKKGDDLDSLLQNLTSQMNNIDNDNPSSRGTCHTCKGHILGEVIQALGKAFHPEHFTCGNCRTPLGTKSFYEHNGSPHCENCYQELFCPKCAHCDKPVLDRCITALGKKWHVDHFICTQCLKPFQGGNFYERDGRPYCELDFYGAFAPKCASCNEAIRGDCINALGSQWHPEHFACAYCQKSFSGGSFFEYGGKPYCETHYHQQTGSQCSGCGKPITGRCVNALNKRWHPEHFVCAFCMESLAGGSFTEQNGKAYCKSCHSKLWNAAST